MNISLAQVQHLARLARLSFRPEEAEAMRTQLSAILDYVEQLNEVDVSNIEPMAHVADMTLRRRVDEPKEVLGRQTIQGSAGYADGFVKVPKIVE